MRHFQTWSESLWEERYGFSIRTYKSTTYWNLVSPCAVFSRAVLCVDSFWETNSFGAFPITEWKSWSRALWRFNPNISKHNILEFGDKSWSICWGRVLCGQLLENNLFWGHFQIRSEGLWAERYKYLIGTCQSTTYCNLVASSEVFVRAVLWGQLFSNKISKANFWIVHGSPWAERYISFFWTYLSITYNNFVATGEGLARAMFPAGNFLWVLSEELVTAFWTGSCGPVFGIHTTYYSISWLMEEFINLMISQFVYWSLCELRIGYFSTTSTFQSSQLQVPTFHFEQIESSGASKLQSSRVRLRMDIYARSYGCCTCVRWC